MLWPWPVKLNRIKFYSGTRLQDPLGHTVVGWHLPERHTRTKCEAQNV